MGEPKTWVKVGPGGKFAHSGTVSTTQSDIDELLGPALAKRQRLLLHVHGGLVKESQGLQIANAMARHYADTACSLSLIWETGLLETFRDNLRGITNTTVFKKALSWVLVKAMGGLGDIIGAKGSAAANQADIEDLLQSDKGIETLDESLVVEANRAVSDTRAKGGSIGTKSENDLADELQFDVNDLQALLEEGAEGSEPISRAIEKDEEAGARGGAATALFLAKVIIAVWKRYRAGTHHDPLPTAVEELVRAAYLAEIGAFAWGGMKQKAEDIWIDDSLTASTTAHVGTYILQRLQQLQSKRPEVTIDLVGHSAGSIVICMMLAAIRAQKCHIRLRNVFFLAPAVRLDVFRTAVCPPLLFEQFRLFTMTDEAEKADKLVSMYPRSLLFLVSGILEDKPGTALAGLERHITKRSASADSSYDDLRRWLATNNRLVLSPSPDNAAEGLQTKVAHHGDFDNDRDTLTSLLFLVKGAP